MTCFRSAAHVTFAAISFIIVAGSANAVVVTTSVHGTLECRKSSGLVTGLGAKGVVSNNSTVSTVSVVCPVDRSYFNTTPLISVSVSDNAAGGAISCRAVAVNAFGATESAGATVSSSGGNQWLVLSQPSTNFADGTYQVRCAIPKRATTEAASSLNSIWVMEENGQ